MVGRFRVDRGRLGRKAGPFRLEGSESPLGSGLIGSRAVRVSDELVYLA